MASMSRPCLRIASLLALAALIAACAERPSERDLTALQAEMRDEGRLRTETEPQDAPFGREALIRNFERIALNHQADTLKPGSAKNSRPNPISRWQGPLRYALRGGATTEADRTETARLMTRIADLTGLDIAEAAPDEANFLILIVAEAGRERLLDRLEATAPQRARIYRFWLKNPSTICVANNLVSGPGGIYLAAATVVIGDEVKGVLRRACLHEEIVQSLGLANDDDVVRPSIFNDDGEFALLTRHDEWLLRILYDPRLAPGMDAAAAMPVVRRIVAGLDLSAAPAETRPE